MTWLPARDSEATMEIDAATVAQPTSTPCPPRQNIEPVPEVEIYLRLLIVYHLLSDKSTYSRAMELVQQTVQKMQALNRRSMDPIAAKVWYAVERAYELTGDLAEARP